MSDILSNQLGKLSKSESGKLGYLQSKETHELVFNNRLKSYFLNPKKCLFCNNTLEYDKRTHKFCSQKCNASYYNTSTKILKNCLCCKKEFNAKNDFSKYCSKPCETLYKRMEIIKKWKNGEIKGYKGKIMIICSWLRNYLFEKYNSKCCKCGWNCINPTTNKIPLEVNHIDGDASNCIENNLELICPNCHSLTSNFRALNPKSKRIRNNQPI